MIEVAATGKLIQGDVLDCNKEHLERALRFYDPQLYLKWNETKLKGYGCWELRTKPYFKTVKHLCNYKGATYITFEYQEYGVENHVKDFAYLNYNILEWVKTADLWSNIGYIPGNKGRVTQWINDLEESERKAKADIKQKSYDDVIYNFMQNKSALRYYRNAVLDANNKIAR